MTDDVSPFLERPPSEWVAANELAFAIRDRFPVSPGHTLVITRRVVATWFDASGDEQRAIMALVEEVKRGLDEELKPDGYNLGINAGAAAGQTVMHLHVHVIPRWHGDVPDPRGGVRHVIPGRGNYLAPAARGLATGGTEDPFKAHLLPLFAVAREVAIVAAFVQESGLDSLTAAIESALARGARVRLITGDYLAITQASALERLLDWQDSVRARADDPDRTALAPAGGGDGVVATGLLESRVIEVERLPAPTRAFHPKSWRFEGGGGAVAFVGSSNLSHSALESGIEWNLRVDQARDPDTYARVTAAFDALWASARPLDRDWVAAYAERATREALPPPPGETEAEPPAPPIPPHEVQVAALAALEQVRRDGGQRALVVFATGLGKTLLAALDARAFLESHAPHGRVLVLAHRGLLLAQAAETFRRELRGLRPRLRLGWCAGARGELDGDVVLAMVQKLGRPEWLARVAPGDFAYVVVDEVHHATAPSYRRILEHLAPGFVLGLTATPDRTDEADVAGLFDDRIAYRADVGEGIALGRLVPFSYFGLRDVADYANLPWANHRFDPALLAAAVETQARMERMWEGWQAHPGQRTLVFCCTISHARFARTWLAARGVRVAAIHSGADSDDRAAALAQLAAGDLDAVCAIDVLNEGVDLPLVDRLVMLRPTDSPVVFLQQLGRGLRAADGKDRLLVLDFVGNHRSFVGRLRTLLSLEPGASVAALLDDDDAVVLPPGCAIDLELEAKDLLRELLRRGTSGASEVERAYDELTDARGERPTAGELYRLGYDPGALRAAHGGWFDFVQARGQLDDGERAAFDAAAAWLRALETTAMTKSFKLVVLEALLDADALMDGLELDELARRCHTIIVRSPPLFAEIASVREVGDARAPDPARWRRYWRGNPIAAWLGEPHGQAWFRIVGERLVPRFAVPTDARDALAALTRELVDYRMVKYRRARPDAGSSEATFTCRVFSNQRDPILKLPSRTTTPAIPTDDTEVRIDGVPWTFRFAKIACNVAHPVGADRNQLPDLLRRWFGLGAGRPGTTFHVRFTQTPAGWTVAPDEPQAVAIDDSPESDDPSTHRFLAYPTLRAAAGATETAIPDDPAADAIAVVRLPVGARVPRGTDTFAIRAAGDSMDGGRDPIRDGDWLVMRLARGVGIGAVENKVALIQTDDPAEGMALQIKRIVRRGGAWQLKSDNPDRPSFEASAATTPIALVSAVVPPERLAPAVGTIFDDDEALAAFGLQGRLATGRIEGHLFLLLAAPDALVRDRLRLPGRDRHPGETAFVLVRTGDARWRYDGVARWSEQKSAWVLPAAPSR